MPPYYPSNITAEHLGWGREVWPEKGKAYPVSASQLPWKTISQLKWQQGTEMSISSYFWVSNDKQLGGSEHADKVSTSKAKNTEVFYCPELEKVALVIEYRMKRCLVCRWLREWKPRDRGFIPTSAKTLLMTSILPILRFPTVIILHLPW